MLASNGDRMPPCGVPVWVSSPVTVLGENARLEERLDQRQHAFVLDPQTHAVHQGRVVDRVKARLDIRIQHPPITLGAED